MAGGWWMMDVATRSLLPEAHFGEVEFRSGAPGLQNKSTNISVLKSDQPQAEPPPA